MNMAALRIASVFEQLSQWISHIEYFPSCKQIKRDRKNITTSTYIYTLMSAIVRSKRIYSTRDLEEREPQINKGPYLDFNISCFKKTMMRPTDLSNSKKVTEFVVRDGIYAFRLTVSLGCCHVT